MFNQTIINVLESLIKEGYHLNLDATDRCITVNATNNWNKKTYKLVFNMSVTVEGGNILNENIAVVSKFVPITDKEKIAENWWITHCASLKENRDLYNFEYDYEWDLDNCSLILKYLVHEWRDMDDEKFFDDEDDIIYRDSETINVKEILCILKNNFGIKQLQFIK
ncbi:hypothetical protein PMX22_21950 [Clostridium butyricum]|uniref:hypothetical protein n=1 Tax=Clostridium butyricum TaxID=1492 RepID=UPI00232CF6E2|nr:hypothetical protein [Clostridium butyricum]MDB2162434.1 hypothetical protein [Clostridium butyricum]